MPNLLDWIRYANERESQNAQLSGQNQAMVAIMNGQQGDQNQQQPPGGQGGPSTMQGGQSGGWQGVPSAMQGGQSGGQDNPAPDYGSMAKQYMETKKMNGMATSDTEQKLSQAQQAGTLHEVISRMPDSARKLMEKMQTSGGLGIEDNMKLNGYLTAASRAIMDRQDQAARAQAMQAQGLQIAQEQMRLQGLQSDLTSSQQLNATADRRLGENAQLQRGVGSGVLTSQAQQTAQDYAQSPAGLLREQGVKLTPEIATQMMGLQAKEEWHNRNFVPSAMTVGGVPGIVDSPRHWTPAKPPAKPDALDESMRITNAYKDAVAKGDMVTALALANKLGFTDFTKSLVPPDQLPGVKPAQPVDPLKPSGPFATGMARPQSKADYDKIPSGSKYIGADGRTYKKQ